MRRTKHLKCENDSSTTSQHEMESCSRAPAIPPSKPKNRRSIAKNAQNNSIWQHLREETALPVEKPITTPALCVSCKDMDWGRRAPAYAPVYRFQHSPQAL